MFATKPQWTGQGKGPIWMLKAGLAVLIAAAVWFVVMKTSSEQELPSPTAMVASQRTASEAATSNAVSSINETGSPEAAGGSIESTRDTHRALKPARQDPFLMPLPPPPPSPAPVVYVAPVVQAAPVIRSEPPPSLLFTGRMTAPDGRVMVLAQWSDGTPVSLVQGKELSNGYRVERLTDQMVELLNPKTQVVVQLPLPPAPRFETR